MSPESRVYLFLSRIRTLQRSTNYHLYRHRGARSGAQKLTAMFFVRSWEEGGLATIVVVRARSRLGTHGAWLIRLSGPALLRASPTHVYLAWRGLKIKLTAVIYNTYSGANLFVVHSYHYDLNVVFYLCARINTY